MENPSLLRNPSVGEILAARGSGHQGGRPSEEVVMVDMVDGLERPGSKIPVGYQPVQKKGRTWDNAIIPEDEIMEADEAKSSENAGVIPGVGGAVEDHKPAVAHRNRRDIPANQGFLRDAGWTTDSGGTGSRFQLLTATMEEVEPVGPMNVSVGEENTRNEALAKGDVVGVTAGSSDDGIKVSGTCPIRPV
ncbi:hypothetical protein V6N11_000632 [Hibiscus sabdariffa]|uniref:Uncharacterized protein n=1 Tax=Hibiscus sabdariffa TaxID=183260 RepID=A0ABR2NEN5_9ROSI